MSEDETPIDLAAIGERADYAAAFFSEYGAWPSGGDQGDLAHQDRFELLAEVERLRTPSGPVSREVEPGSCSTCGQWCTTCTKAGVYLPEGHLLRGPR